MAQAVAAMMLRPALGLALAALVGLAGASRPVAAPRPSTTLIRGAWVFDGERMLGGPRDVLIRGDRIVRVSARIGGSADSVVAGAGLTLMPGLTDLHVHTSSAAFPSQAGFVAAYDAYAQRGITAVNEFSVPPDRIAAVRGFRGPAPRVRLAARIGVPGGHGSETEWQEALTATVASPAEASAAMRDVVARRPDMIKIFADGWRYGRSADLADMDAATMRSVVRAAHAARLPVMSHTVTLAGAWRAAGAGVDALGHGVGDAVLDAATIRLMQRKRTGYVPTLSAYEPLSTRVLTEVERDDLSPAARSIEERRVAAPIPPYEARRWAIMVENVRRAAAAGIPIAVGTDAGVTGVHAGWATRHELRLLVAAGLTPAEALRAATQNAARIMRDPRGGRVRRGARADLLLVAGRPDQDLDALYAVRGVWVGGRQLVAGAR